MEEQTYPHIDLIGLKELYQRLGNATQEALSNGRGLRLYLYGELGSGKTTCCQLLIAALCAVTRAPSPTYGLVHPYPIVGVPQVTAMLYHLDCYRLQSPSDLVALGIDTLDEANTVLLVEWPQQVQSALPQADIEAHLSIQFQEHEHQHSLRLVSRSPHGSKLLKQL